MLSPVDMFLRRLGRHAEMSQREVGLQLVLHLAKGQGVTFSLRVQQQVLLGPR